MPDDERTVAQLAAAFRQVLVEEGRVPDTDDPADEKRRSEDALLAATGAALGDLESLRRPGSPQEG